MLRLCPPQLLLPLLLLLPPLLRLLPPQLRPRQLV
jgi:hypothetical protein